MVSETATRIMEAAKSLMVERGYSAFSYADVSERIGIRKASIHYHFPAKSDLAVAVLKGHREKLEESMEFLDGKFTDPAARLRAYVKHWEGCIRDQTVPICVAALLSAEMPALPEDVQAEVRRHFESLGKWIERTLKAGVQSHSFELQGAASAEAQYLMAAVHGAMLSARASGSCDVFRTVTKAGLDRLGAKA